MEISKYTSIVIYFHLCLKAQFTIIELVTSRIPEVIADGFLLADTFCSALFEGSILGGLSTPERQYKG